MEWAARAHGRLTDQKRACLGKSLQEEDEGPSRCASESFSRSHAESVAKTLERSGMGMNGDSAVSTRVPDMVDD